MATNYFAANIKRESKRDLLYATVVCKDMKESEKLFKLIDAVSEWGRVEAMSRNGRKVTVTFFEKTKHKYGNRKKKMSKL